MRRDERQDGPQDRPVPLPGTDHGDRHARDPETVTGWMGPFYELKDQLQRDEAMRVSSWAFMRKASSIIR